MLFLSLTKMARSILYGNLLEFKNHYVKNMCIEMYIFSYTIYLLNQGGSKHD